ncbi:MAG TPA: alpha-1,4-glucan--maltose-1-phosphate maltosyltransferase [Candidatus Limnocylindrales bacterium]|nr:alpha-1,4-glucan--maltose-1-phosphate maltosyltransferase [Candidatus Limnocylindrales bacterium]
MSEATSNGRLRVVIARLSPEIDCGRFAIKRVKGEKVVVEADVFADGHDQVACQLLYWQDGNEPQVSPMKPLGNDRWRGEFCVLKLGRYTYTIEGWVDHFQTWRQDLGKRISAKQDISVDLQIGAGLIEEAAARANGKDGEILLDWARRLRESKQLESQTAIALDTDLLALVQLYPERELVTRYDKQLSVVVDRDKAGFSSWYEVFPRSCSPDQKRHGTFRDCERWLPYIASMGFDVLYLPPIHPIGRTFRKGRNNTLPAESGDVGSPWAIGSVEGGHKSIHPELGTLEDFRRFLAKAADHGLEVALDIALQCSPDHPYVREHPEWFSTRPDGSIQYAENPPKKYQDIFPLNFATAHWQALWDELKSIFLFWIEQGVRIFRVDNPHTKAFPFWEWVITEIKNQHPDVLFLAEAFTRPNVMYRLAKLGFSQSYTYFTWRNAKQELTQYFTELAQTDVREYLRPNLWPNTPDILPEFLQVGGRPAFMVRLILAATLGGNYGIYGPSFEVCENAPLQPGGEEYLHSEKYELKHRDLGSKASLKNFIASVNRIRRENPALQSNRNLCFHETDNPALICFTKATDDLSNVIVVVVNLDCSHVQSGWITLDLDSIGLNARHAFQAHDLLSEGRFLWQGSRNYVELVPESLPAHILLLRRWVRTERDFDYYL